MAKILIVEDDEEIAMLERDYLEIEGFQAQVISDGGAAEEAALTGAYDLILLDLMLPGRSGYEVCRRIRDQVDVPILMVTARTESVDKIRGLGLGGGRLPRKTLRPGGAGGTGQVPPEPVSAPHRRPRGGRRRHPGGGPAHPPPELEGL